MPIAQQTAGTTETASRIMSSAAALKASRRDAALPPEESALADLYQVVGLLPELKNPSVRTASVYVFELP